MAKPHSIPQTTTPHDRVAGTASALQKNGIKYFGLEASKCSGPTSSLTSKGVWMGHSNSSSTKFNDKKVKISQEHYT